MSEPKVLYEWRDCRGYEHRIIAADGENYDSMHQSMASSGHWIDAPCVDSQNYELLRLAEENKKLRGIVDMVEGSLKCCQKCGHEWLSKIPYVAYPACPKCYYVQKAKP